MFRVFVSIDTVFTREQYVIGFRRYRDAIAFIRDTAEEWRETLESEYTPRVISRDAGERVGVYAMNNCVVVSLQ